MKKYQIVLIAVFSLVVVLWIGGRATRAIQFITLATKANEPTYKTGSLVLTSNLITPIRLDIICYEGADPTDQDRKTTFVHRVCGLQGDTIEIKDGDLFVNGDNLDRSLNLKKFYRIPRQVAAQLDFEENEVISHNADSVIAPLETIKQADIIKKGILHLDFTNYELIKKNYNQASWSTDNFGPYVVPVNTYFVIGDNRNFSLDSRLLGPVEKKNVLFTVIK